MLVAGGGPAGLEAARLLALRGHAVTLCEREPELGGLALAAVAAEPNNAPLLDELLRAVAAAKIELRLGCEVNAALVAELDPDAVVVAVGARRVRPAIPGADAAHVLDPWQLRGGIRSGARARSARRRGRRRPGRRRDRRAPRRAAAPSVSLSRSRPCSRREMAPPRRWRAVHLLAEHGVARHRGAQLGDRAPARALRRRGRRARELAADSVVLSEAAPPTTRSPRARGRRAAVHRIGDCATPGYFDAAFTSAAALAARIAEEG